jgi:transcription initiation factor TFIIB
MRTSVNADRGLRSDQQKTPTECPDCEGPVRIESGETVCEDCGFVFEAERIDHGPEWRAFEDDSLDPERTGAPLTPSRHDRGLSTEIGRHTDAKGNAISGRKRRQLSRLRREHSRGLAVKSREKPSTRFV